MARTQATARSKNFIATIDSLTLKDSYGIPWTIKRRVTKDNNKIANVDYNKVVGTVVYYEPDEYKCQKVDYEFAPEMIGEEIFEIMKVLNRFMNAQKSYLFLTTKVPKNNEIQRVLNALHFEEDPVNPGYLVQEVDITNGLAIGMGIGTATGALAGAVLPFISLPLGIIIGIPVGTAIGTVFTKKRDAKRSAWREARTYHKDTAGLEAK